MDKQTPIGEVIRALRKGARMKQKEVSDALGMSLSGYCQIETGVHKISLSKLTDIAQFFGKRPWELLDMTDAAEHRSSTKIAQLEAELAEAHREVQTLQSTITQAINAGK